MFSQWNYFSLVNHATPHPRSTSWINFDAGHHQYYAIDRSSDVFTGYLPRCHFNDDVDHECWLFSRLLCSSQSPLLQQVRTTNYVTLIYPKETTCVYAIELSLSVKIPELICTQE